MNRKSYKKMVYTIIVVAISTFIFDIYLALNHTVKSESVKMFPSTTSRTALQLEPTIGISKENIFTSYFN